MTETSRVVVVTGLSGAGKSTALHALEDLGYFCVDNLPTSLVEHVVAACEAGGVRRIGLGIDHDGALRFCQRVAAANLGAQHGRFRQPGFQQIAAAQTGRFALRRDSDFDVEAVALLDLDGIVQDVVGEAVESFVVHGVSFRRLVVGCGR